MRIVRCQTIREMEKVTIEGGVGSEQLMYRAANGILTHLQQCVNLLQSDILILCGAGNNGGDGYCLATLLHPICRRVRVCQILTPPKTKDAQLYAQKCAEMKIENVPIDEISPADVVVDAVFGAGYSGTLPKIVKEVFSKIKQWNCLRVAVDLPSGMQGDGEYLDIDTFMADMTVTFQYMKLCHVLPKSAPLCGTVTVCDIGLVSISAADGEYWHCIDAKEIECRLPKRNEISHKGDFGTLFSVVGCQKYQGAACLSAMASLRCGCGILQLFIPSSIYHPLAAKVNSAIISCCLQTEEGTLQAGAWNDILSAAQTRKPTALLIGSGISDHIESLELVEKSLGLDLPLVIDGDGIRAIDKLLPSLQKRKQATIITPHVGEFARLCHCTTEEVLKNFHKMALPFAEKNNVIVVLKSSVTLIALPNGEAWYLYHPNAGLAKGGSGDVLAGMIASFAAQGISAVDSALLGVYFHSKAAKAARNKYGSYSMLPEDIVSEIAQTIKNVSF